LLANFSTVLVNNNLHIWIASGNCSGYAWQTAVTAFLQRLLPAAGLLLLDWDLPQLLAWSAAAGFAAVAASARLPLRLAVSGTGFVGFSTFWPESRHYYFSSLIKAGAGQFDQFLAPVLMAPESMAVYYVIRRFYSLAVLAIDAVVEVQVPALSRTAGRDAARARRHLQLLLAGVVLAGGTGAALLAGNGLSLVQLLFGPGYGQHPWLITSFALCAFCYGLHVYLQVEMFLLFEPHCTTRLTTVTAVANCMAGPLAGWMLGMHGLPLAMAGSLLFALDRIGNFRNRAECPWPVLLSLLVLISGAGLTGAAAAGMDNAVIRVVLVNTAIAAIASTLLFRRAQLLRRSL
jgi:O-antigen/teichoic acid export membrane protein